MRRCMRCVSILILFFILTNVFIVKILEADFKYLDRNEEKEKAELSKMVFSEQELFNMIRRRQFNDTKNIVKKSSKPKRKGKSKVEKTAEEKEAERILSEENYNRRPDNEIIIMQDDFQHKKYPLVKRTRIIVNGL